MTTKHRTITPTSRATEHIGLLTYLRTRAAFYRKCDQVRAFEYARWARAVDRLLSERAARRAGKGGVE